MDYHKLWVEFPWISYIEGRALIRTDGVLMNAKQFGTRATVDLLAAQCASLVSIHKELALHTGRGNFEWFCFNAELGYLVVVPVDDEVILAALTRSEGRLKDIFYDLYRVVSNGKNG